jgi:hypothetical protein
VAALGMQAGLNGSNLHPWQDNHQKGRSMSQRSFWERFPSSIKVVLHAPVFWFGLLGVLLTLLIGRSLLLQAHAPAPADLFMQSVVQRDGTLGWHQLCPELQAQEPLSLLTSQVQQERMVELRQGLSLSMDYIGAHPRPQGGQIRLYVVTAHLPDGWTGQRTYIVYTQTSGCVEDVKNF